MTGFLVDTNIPSELTRDQPDARVAVFIRKAGQGSLFLSVMTIGEIRKGIDLLPVSQKRSDLQDWLDIEVRAWFADRILPVTENIAERWGRMAAAAKKKGVTLAVVDGIIAATALEQTTTSAARYSRSVQDCVRSPRQNPWSARWYQYKYRSLSPDQMFRDETPAQPLDSHRRPWSNAGFLKAISWEGNRSSSRSACGPQGSPTLRFRRDHLAGAAQN